VMSKCTRCAIYTRKSTEHNLDLEFNSLHAQREACEAYIKSQIHEGWVLVPDPYDDGGISGASLERPDLQRLLGDIAAGKVDTVVVYKVDRLTRSLTDFAKLVDLFDRHDVSFVSVTQAFNTTSSMGRLTLNVLLSFAQFEREVIGERVRDKIAASKRKGLFMGGNIPLGYLNKDKKLVIVPEEAERIRWMFQRYLELGSIGHVLEEMNRLGLRTKVLTLSSGKRRGGVPFGKGALAYLLKNRCYVGEISHKGQIHAADHDPIITRETFEAVQVILAANTVARRAKSKTTAFLLTGCLFDSAGNRMTPSHSRKKGVRYRYYVSQAVLQSRKGEAGEVFRVPAPEIEALIGRFLRDHYRDQQTDLRSLIEAQITKISIEAGSISVELGGATDSPSSLPTQIVSLPWTKRPFRVPKGVVAEPTAPTISPDFDFKARESVLAAIKRAKRWVDQLIAGTSLPEIASQEGMSPRHIRLLTSLAFVSPHLMSEIINGDKPYTATNLAGQVPLVW
jgi:site-specific DNA recombinase